MNLVDLEETGLSEADDLLDRAAHDVAKYMSLTARNLPPSPVPVELAEALRGELERTDGRRAAWELWVPISEALHALAADPALEAIDREMARLEALVASKAEPAVLARATLLAADRIATLRRAVRRRLAEAVR